MASSITNPMTLSVDQPSATQTSTEKVTAIHMDEEMCTCDEDDMDENVCTCTEEEIKDREIEMLREQVYHLSTELDRTTEQLKKARQKITRLQDINDGYTPEEGKVFRQLDKLRQTGSMEDYIARFQRLVSKMGFDDWSLIECCLPGMKERVKSEMYMWAQPDKFTTFVGMAIDIDWHQNMRRQESERERQRQLTLSLRTEQT